LNQNKKILHVVNISFVLPYFIGDQFEYFINNGYELHVACTPSTHLKNYSNKKKFSFLEVKILREINIITDIIAIFKLVIYIRNNNIDIIIGHTPKGGLLAMISGFLSGKSKLIYFRHGLMYETSHGFKRFILKYIEKFTGLLANKVICVSPSVLDQSNKNLLSNRSKNIILGNGTCNGIDTLNKYNINNIDNIDKLRSQLGIEKDDLVLGYVGRMVKDKGIIELLEAWNFLKFKYVNLKLLLVGPFEERDTISDSYKNLILTEPTIKYVGLSDETNIYYALMDVFVLLSYREGFPTVVLEASSMEIPIVTTKSTGCIDSIIPGETGLYTDLYINSIVDKISKYIDDINLRKEHGRNGRIFVQKKFQQEIVWESLKKVIETP
jgi:glycosyltransferase involved in cell wall biosynthesis